MEIGYHADERGFYVTIVTDLGRNVAKRAAQLALDSQDVYITCVFDCGNEPERYYIFRTRP